MGISLKQRRRKHRRGSYADYTPPGSRGPRNDPFRIVFYLVVIAIGVWVYVNRENIAPAVLAHLTGPTPTAAATTPVVANSTQQPSGSPTAVAVSESDFLTQANRAYEDGRIQDAIDAYTQAATLNPNNADSYVQIARLTLFKAALQYGDTRDATLQDALDAADTAILIDPFSAAGYAIKGKVQDWQGTPDQAQSTILRAIDLDSGYALAHSYLSEALIDQTRWTQAQQSIDEALSLEPNNVDVRRDYAYLLENLGDYSGAALQYETALRIAPNLAYIQVALGRVYRVLGRTDDAIAQFQLAQALLPGNPVILFEFGRTYETYLGDYTSALSYYQQATDLDQNYGVAWLRIGTLRYIQGTYAEAAIAFEQALALGVESDDLYYQLGLSYVANGRCDKALPYLEQAHQRAQVTQDQRILDAVASGYTECQVPTPTFSPTITPTPSGP